jgi:inner membrane protein
MSSVFAHALTGASISLVKQLYAPGSTRILWFLWLTLVAIAPDFDYLISTLNPKAHAGLRITHSLLGVMLLPLVTIACLWLCQRSKWPSAQNPKASRIMAIQVLLAGASHFLMDLLVGVTPLPPFWPWSSQTVRLPFGILPSAGRLWPVSSYYVYHNLIIETGVMVPLLYGCYLLFQPFSAMRWRTIGVLWLCSGICMYWASTLSRPKL